MNIFHEKQAGFSYSHPALDSGELFCFKKVLKLSSMKDTLRSKTDALGLLKGPLRSRRVKGAVRSMKASLGSMGWLSDQERGQFDL